MFNFYGAASTARRMNISCKNDPDIYKQEALKYAKMFGDNHIYAYNKWLLGNWVNGGRYGLDFPLRN